MRRPLQLLNLALGLVAVLIAVAVVKTWVSPVAPIPSSSTAMTSQDTEVLAYSQSARPPVNQFDVLLDKNPFKQPPPMPAQASAVAPPPPLPTLVGTILVDQERRAILSDKGKANIYSTGQGVAGGVITEIKEDRILFKRGDTAQEIMLKAAIESGAAPPARTGAPVAGQTVGAGLSFRPAQPTSPPSSSGEPADKTELLRRRQERQQLREQRRGLRGKE
ncbi:MAG: hypothetical protein KGL31_03115 [candidate division NC10 bacterium]|nr:hypothetical protein [candidate division NC10 bacterium]MDE2320896.1 hypothetical protein [candidate division NC10 bacterium]